MGKIIIGVIALFLLVVGSYSALASLDKQDLKKLAKASLYFLGFALVVGLIIVTIIFLF